MSKVDLAKILIENDWCNRTLGFIAKAYKIDDATMKAFINGNQPTITEETLNEYVNKVDEILNAEEKSESDKEEETADESKE